MNRRLRLLLLHALTLVAVPFAALALSTLAAADEGWKAGGWKAGVAKTNITPEQPMWMAGYASRDRPAEGRQTDLWAKALVLEDAEGQRALLLTVDLVGIDRDLSLAIRNQIGQRFGFDLASIAVCTSHTHSGPVVGRNLAPMHYAIVPEAQQRLIDQYAFTLQAKIIETVRLAVDDLQPSRLQHGRGEASFAINRRNNPADEVPVRRSMGALVGPFDHDVPVLAVRSNKQEWKAIVFGYACHATVLNAMQWSGDYPGFAQIELEQLYPGAQAMFWAGCGADQNPVPRRTSELARHYGRRLATAVDAVLMTSQLSDIEPALRTSYAEIALELDALPTADLLRQTLRDGNRYQQSRARILLERIEAGQPLDSSYPFPVGIWKLGNDLRWVMLGGEVVVDYGLRLKRELDGPVWIAAYTNDVMAYIPSRRVLREGGYEGASSMVYYGLPTVWAPTIENAIVQEVARQADAMAQ